MAKIYSTAQVAENLGISPGRVTQCARRWGLGRKLNREWMFTPADVTQIEKRKGKIGFFGHEFPRGREEKNK